MNKITVLIFVLAITLGLLSLAWRPKPDTAPARDIENITRSPISVGWIPYWGQTQAVQSFYNHVDALDYIGLFWYKLDKNGTILTYESAQLDSSIVTFAHQHGVKVLALIANMPDSNENEEDWDWQRVDAVISSSQKRTEHIRQLIELVQQNSYDGLAIDYENLEERQRDDFSVFIEELGTELHRINKELSVAIHPITSGRDPKEDNGSRAQDLSRLFKAADQLHLMTYGEHDENTGPGANASLEWTNRVLKYILSTKNAVREKVFLGIPLDATVWDSDANGEGLVYTQVQNLIDTYAPKIEWHAAVGEPGFKFQSNDGETHTVWFTNQQSVKQKTDLAQKYDVGGLSFWRLGGEDPTIWESVK